jgi:hypothetical protein
MYHTHALTASGTSSSSFGGYLKTDVANHAGLPKVIKNQSW